jgi:hypothetical protein
MFDLRGGDAEFEVVELFVLVSPDKSVAFFPKKK